MKFRDIWGRVRRHVEKLNKSELEAGGDRMIVPRSPEIAREVVEESRARADVRIHSLARYIWVNPGLNNKERRTLAVQLKRGYTITARGKRQPLSNEAKKFIKFQLKNSPKNVPAHRDANGQLATNNPIYAAFAAERGVKVVG